MKKRRLTLNKAGEITISDFSSQVGPVSSAVFLTGGNLKEKKRKKKDSLFPELLLKSMNDKLDRSIEILETISKKAKSG